MKFSVADSRLQRLGKLLFSTKNMKFLYLFGNFGIGILLLKIKKLFLHLKNAFDNIF